MFTMSYYFSYSRQILDCSLIISKLCEALVFGVGVGLGEWIKESFLDKVVELDFEYGQDVHKKKDPRVLACAVH